MQNRYTTLAISSLQYITLGILTAALGPALPTLAANTESPLETLGTVFSALFLGALIAQFVAGPLTDRLGPPRVIAAGIVLLALGTGGIVLSGSLSVLLCCTLIAGLGHGTIDLSNNVLIAGVFKDRSVTTLNILHFSFGFGAVIGPVVASFTLRQWGTALPALWLVVGIVVICLPLVALFMVSPEPHSSDSQKVRDMPVYRVRWLWLIGLLILVYVGTENGISGWTATYIKTTTSLSFEIAALVGSGFWAALTVGRLVGAALGVRMTSTALLLLSLSGSLIGGMLMAFSTGNATLSILAVLLTGLSFGPIFPTAFALLTAHFHYAPGRAASLVAAMGSVGAMLIPPVQGLLLERLGANSSVLLVAGCVTLMLVIFVPLQAPPRSTVANTASV